MRWRSRHFLVLGLLGWVLAGAAMARIPLPARLTMPGALTFCADMHNPPTASMGPDGRRAQGIGVDLMHALAAQFNAPVRVRSYRPAGIFAALDTGKCDAILASLSRTPERERRYDFVDYFEVASDLLLARGAPVAIDTIEALSGRRVAVLLGSRNEAWLKELNRRFVSLGRAPVRIVALGSNVAAFQMLDLGRVHAFLSDTMIVGYYQTLDPGRFVSAGLRLRQGTVLSIALGKGRNDLAAGLQAAMDAIHDDGQLARIVARWGIQAGVRLCSRRSPCPHGAGD